MKFETSIIHLKRSVDRHKLINSIRAFLPDSRIHDAFEPVWEEKDDVRSIRGSSISHLLAYEVGRLSGLPHLVLEDDVVVSPEGLQELLKVDSLPSDCGVLLTGSETPYSFFQSGPFWEVKQSFHGAHGVLYNTPVLEQTKFLELCWKYIAVTNLSQEASCYEGVLGTAMQSLGLKVYRLDSMAFGTDGSVVSLRRGIPLPPRSIQRMTDVRPPEVNEESPIPFYKQ